MTNDSQELENKPSSSKDMWLFLIILDVIFLCVFGFFLYKHFSGQLFSVAAPSAPATEEPAPMQEDALPEIVEEVVTVEATPALPPQTVETAEPVKEVLQAEPAPTVVKKATEQVAPAKESIVVTNLPNSKYRRVTFRWFGDGSKVSVVSGFTMSKPQALKKVGDHWETTLSIAPGTYKFLYIIDGKNTLDPYAEEKDGRSVLVVK